MEKSRNSGRHAVIYDAVLSMVPADVRLLGSGETAYEVLQGGAKAAR